MGKMTLQTFAGYAGRELGVSSWVVIGQERIDEFAQCTGDRQWIHVEPERARSGPFAATVAHGYLVLSLLAPTSQEVWWGELGAKAAVNYGLDRVRFIAPVRSGSRVRNRIRLVSVEPRGEDTMLVTTENTIEIEGEAKPALIAVALSLLSN